MTLVGDLRYMLEDPTFRDTVSVITPDGTTVNDVFGMFQDVSQDTDPQTGPNINDGVASFAATQAHLDERGLSDISGTADENAAAWYVVHGSNTYLVLYTMPDNSTGAIMIFLGKATT